MRTRDRLGRLLAMLAALATIFLSAVIVGSKAGASREILSDLDCIVEPSMIAEVGSAVPGLLESVHYDRADYVQGGQVMAVLESSVERAALRLARRAASIDTAIGLRKLNADFGARTRHRNQGLLQKSSISPQNMDQVSTEASIAALQLQQEVENQQLAHLEVQRAQAALSRRTVISPFTGTVTRRFKTVGEYVEGEPVFELAQLNPLHVEVVLPLQHLGTVSGGMRGVVSLHVPSLSDQQFSATVRRIDSIADAASGTYGVRLELPNSDLKIPAGVRCQVDFIAD